MNRNAPVKKNLLPTDKVFRIVFFSCEPGGAEILIPVIRLLQKLPNYEVTVLSYGHGLARFAAKNIPCQIISKLVPHEMDLLTKLRPNVLITSATSLPDRDMSERYLWVGARELGIPSIAFLDQWQNYALRFSGCGENERLRYLPDYINCINAVAQKDMLAEGFEEHRLKMFGHPYLSSLKEIYNQLDKHEITTRLHLPPDQPVALFVSEAIAEHYGRSRGYDQYDALRLFFDIIAASPQKLKPLIKLHPKDEREGYEIILSDYTELSPFIIQGELNSLECIKIADDVYGMTSIMLIEAFTLGKRVVSLQPGLAGSDLMVLSKLGYIKKCTTQQFTGTFDAPSVSPNNPFEFDFNESAFLEFLNTILLQTHRNGG